jgi:WD40 repeat protein
VSVVNGRSAKIWDLTTRTTRMVLVGHSATLTSASWEPRGRMVVTTSEDGTARLWDPTTGDEIARLQHHGLVRVAAFSPDGQQLALGFADESTLLLTLPSYGGRPTELDELVRCRVPYEFKDENIQHREPACTR